MKVASCRGVDVVVALFHLVLVLYRQAASQTAPTSITFPAGSALCRGGSESVKNVCITLPPDSVTNKVDVFFLFDDTGSFSDYSLATRNIFANIVDALELALPAVDFGFGVGRFEDFVGYNTNLESYEDQPFILNQKIVTTEQAGSKSARNQLIQTALGAEAPGYGGDSPESSIDALYRAVTGIGSSYTPAGGAEFRQEALKLILLATDVCTVAPFSNSTPIPATIAGLGSTEPISAFACDFDERFGFLGEVAPSDAATVPETVAALNALGVRVIGLGPIAGPTSSTTPSTNDPSILLSALARLTGAVDAEGFPLVFSISGGSGPLQTAIVKAINTTATLPVNIELEAEDSVGGLAVAETIPAVVNMVAPGDAACFNVTFTTSSELFTPPERFATNLVFKDDASGAQLGIVPVNGTCPLCQNNITGFTLIDADKDVAIGPLPALIDYSELPTKNLNVRVEYSSCVEAPINSVYCVCMDPSTKNSTKRCERWTPYAVFGDNNTGGPDLGELGPFYPFTFPAGPGQIISATPFTGDNCNGVAGLGKNASVDVVCNNEITGFVLVDGDLKQDIGPLPSVIDYAQYPTKNLNVRVEYSSCPSRPIDSVSSVFKSCHTRFKTCDDVDPYLVFDNKGDDGDHDHDPHLMATTGGDDHDDGDDHDSCHDDDPNVLGGGGGGGHGGCCRDNDPYVLSGGGDHGGYNHDTCHGTFPIEKNQTIKSTPWTGTMCKNGVAGVSKNVSFDVINTAKCPGKVLSLVLWDVSKNSKWTPLMMIKDGATICPKTTNYNLEARVVACKGGQVGSIKFQMAGKNGYAVGVEKHNRYFMFGSLRTTILFGGGSSGGGVLANGSYQITATPYPLSLVRGAHGASLSVGFTVDCRSRS